MKILCEKKKLSTAINSVVQTKSGGIFFTTISNNQAKVITNDADLGFENTFECEVISQGKVYVNANMLSELVKKLPNEVITLELKTKNLVITCNTITYKLSILDLTTVIELPRLQETITISSSILKDAINKVLFAVSTDQKNRPIYTGCLFEINNNTLNAVAIDGYKLALNTQNIDSSNSFKAIIPSKTLAEISRRLEDDKIVSIGLSQNQVLFQINEYKIVSKILEGEFLNYSKIIPNSVKTRFRVEKQKLLLAFERLYLLSDKENNTCHFSIINSQLILTINNQKGNAKEILNISIEGEEKLDINFAVKLFIDTLKTITDENIYLTFTDYRNGCVITPILNNEYKYLILPIKKAA